jgi:predicted transcriptional regulator of viral defense system
VTQYKLLDQLFADNLGILTTADAVHEGVSKPMFYQYVKEHSIEPVSHGVYAMPDAWVDEMYLLHVRCEEAIFSHESALFFHDLTDREPIRHTITVKTGYNPTRLTKDGIKVYTIKRDLHQIGAGEMTTSFGHVVPVYDMERTICDLIRSRSSIEMQIFQDAMKGYAKRKDKNLQRLLQYASLFHVETILRQYLEVLL